MARSNGSGDILKLGIMGGTFDPIHNGHLQVAAAALEKLSLERALFIPAGQPWMKADRDITPAEHRVAMVRLAIADNPRFELSTAETDRPGPSYTVDTLRQLGEEIHHKVVLYLILSWNTLAELPQWKDPEEIIRLCNLVAVPRPGYRKPTVSVLEAKIKGIKKKIIWLDGPVNNISATAIRERVKKRESIKGLVPAEVEEYIHGHRLYL